MTTVDIQQLKSIFQTTFGVAAQHLFFAPGRVNLIGEHIDYNGGHVFPCALDIGTYTLCRLHDKPSTTLRLYSVNFESVGVVEIDLTQLVFDESHDWANYPAGVVKVMQSHGLKVTQGMDVLFFGNIPNGAGLSSSASIEVATAVMLNDLFDGGFSHVQLALFAQESENQFIGVNTGIMDQFASSMGKVDHAMLLNTQSLAYEYVPVELGDQYQLLIANTNKRRELNESKYNERRAECEAALRSLQTELSIKDLCELDVATFDQYAHLITNPDQLKRARHAVAENQRTLEAVSLLRAGHIKEFGQLMNASHISLRDDYEVTGKYLDELVQAAWDHGAVGARMTGAGFGGCTVMLVQAAQADEFKQQVLKQYQERTDLQATFYDVRIGRGAGHLESWS